MDLTLELNPTCYKPTIGVRPLASGYTYLILFLILNVMYLIMVQKENKIPQKQSTAKESLDYICEMVVL